MNTIVVPAVNVSSADFLVDSFVSCVIRAADVMDAIAAVPSTLSAIVSSVSSSSQQVQEPKKKKEDASLSSSPPRKKITATRTRKQRRW
jgi:hypothetical protein